MGTRYHMCRVGEARGMLFELFQVQNLIRKIRLNQYINIQIDVSQSITAHYGRQVNVAVEQSSFSVATEESKDVVPAIQPIVFNCPGASANFTQEIMPHVVFELSVENNERLVLPR